MKIGPGWMKELKTVCMRATPLWTTYLPVGALLARAPRTISVAQSVLQPHAAFDLYQPSFGHLTIDRSVLETVGLRIFPDMIHTVLHQTCAPSSEHHDFYLGE